MAAMESKSRPQMIARGKFATPPVKIACLACRTARVRCDGKEPCAGCVRKARECIFPTHSRRGGPRVHRTKRSSAQAVSSSGSTPAEPRKSVAGLRCQDCNPNQPCSANHVHWNSVFEQAVPSMILPGSGLTNLDDVFVDTDNLFNTIFHPTANLDVPAQSISPPPIKYDQTGAGVRTYRTTSDLLNAYYTWLHPFFPILPPPVSYPILDCPTPWSPHTDDLSIHSSPLSLAISTILALIPLTEDENASQDYYMALRRDHAQVLARRTLDSIEMDSEIPDSSFSPANALLKDGKSLPRKQFHSQLPVELESVVALCLLSVYEYAQRGNLKKMRDRAGQALVAAMDLQLHCQDKEHDQFSEARRRTWWMTYVCICQSSIVSCTQPAISAHDPRFTTPYPTLALDQEAWPFFIKSQQTILSATQFVRQLNDALETRSDMLLVYERMQELHSLISGLITSTEQWPHAPASASPVDAFEGVVASSLKAMSKIKLNSARIKVHRFCAFSDIPVFSERHCDLKKATPISADVSDQGGASLVSCCSSALPMFSSNTPASRDISSESSLSPSSSLSGPSGNHTFSFPFTSHESSRICLKSGINIAKAFESLPFPCPITPLQNDTTTTHWMSAPRTMPSFACCAMQSAYALLNLHHKAFVMVGSGQDDHFVSSFLLQCETGLDSILKALENYSVAFEALSGMRDQVRVAIDCLSASAW